MSRKRFLIEEVISEIVPEDSRYEIFDFKLQDIVGTFYFKWFLRSHVEEICKSLEKRINK